MRPGFTLLELLIVMGVICALLAMGSLGVGTLVQRARIGNTRTVVIAVASAIEGRGERTLALRQDPASPASEAVLLPAWDIDRDGMIDGDPARDPRALHHPGPEFSALDRARAAQAGYRGLAAAAPNLALPKGHLDADGHLTDAWGRPLRIAYARAGRSFGGDWVGVWSAGPDGVDSDRPDGGDDIRSWSDERKP